ncbi:hypothetical protein NQ317_014431 [Molorchus minor]|uniref:Uncharacterized protein n=1 Tax=Molorchus minor TaxID=1323400 RepID=A0ABQ9K830_9CUCU|nr:hypothetical protein NQ317_014431 [Molorchus minor]
MQLDLIFLPGQLSKVNRRAYESQSEEIRKLKKQLVNSEQRVKELEDQDGKKCVVYNCYFGNGYETARNISKTRSQSA